MLNNSNPVSEREAAVYAPLSLAYVGDGVYELMIREKLLLQANRSNGKLHNAAQKYVSAGGQCVALGKIESLLTEDEQAVFRRGRNAHSSHNRNNTVDEYKRATGLEALFGYLYLCGKTRRLQQLFDIITEEPAE